MRTVLIVCGILQLWIALKLSCNEAVMFKMTNAVCESYNESWVVIHKCRVRAISRNKTTFNFNGTFLHPAYKIHYRAELFQKANGYKPWLVNATVDVCRFLKRPFHPFAILLGKLFLEFSNFNHTCPYNGTQIIDGFYLKWTALPHTLPTGEYLLGMTWILDGRPTFITNVYFIFTEDLTANH
ncbi:uncharacterized protein LOC108652690 [Drosophila navojoa]|uniref:uncharacterized protein LOC108652690 n=1 Tax=Drosophila navojoa TaxID=7232 RepID=UPI0008476185|nr:uncharacterized protein LOC108652690 [Drosophila navojoa]